MAANPVMAFQPVHPFVFVKLLKGGNMTFTSIIDSIDGIVWGIPTIVLILATGLINFQRERR